MCSSFSGDEDDDGYEDVDEEEEDEEERQDRREDQKVDQVWLKTLDLYLLLVRIISQNLFWDGSSLASLLASTNPFYKDPSLAREH